MAEIIGYTIIISEVKTADSINKSREPILNIEVKDIDTKKLIQFVLDNAEFDEENPTD